MGSLIVLVADGVVVRLEQAAACAYHSGPPSSALLDLATLVRAGNFPAAAQKAIDERIDVVSILSSPQLVEKVVVQATVVASGQDGSTMCLPVVNCVPLPTAPTPATTVPHRKRYITEVCDCGLDERRNKINEDLAAQNKHKTKLRMSHDSTFPCFKGSAKRQATQAANGKRKKKK